MSNDPHIFDRGRVARHRKRASAGFAAFDFLAREMAERLCERLEDVTRRFPVALDLGAHHGVMGEVLAGRGGVEQLVQTDLSEGFLKQARGLRVVADEEFLPFADNSFDLVISAGSLHWVNDLPGTLVQVRRVLKPDGLFLAMMPGGRTLMELRQAFELAEAEISGGMSPRVSPFIEVRDAGALLQRAGFALPVADSEILEVRYDHPLKLLRDLRGMGQANALRHGRKHFTARRVLFSAMERYVREHTGQDGRVPASFELVTLTAWKPHASQQQPARRGSGQVSMIQALKD